MKVLITPNIFLFVLLLIAHQATAKTGRIKSTKLEEERRELRSSCPAAIYEKYYTYTNKDLLDNNNSNNPTYLHSAFLPSELGRRCFTLMTWPVQLVFGQNEQHRYN